jgi:hypothetical protein
MKRLIICLLALTLISGVVFAQDEGGGAQAEMVKKKALGIRDANNASQGITPASPQPPPQPVVAAPRGIDPAQQQLIDKLQSALTATAAAPAATAAQTQTLHDDMLNLAKGTTKPSSDALSRLATSLVAALSGGNLSLRNPAQLAKALNVVVNTGNLTPAQAQTFVTLARNNLKASGVSEQAAQTITDNLKAIVGELQKGRSGL